MSQTVMTEAALPDAPFRGIESLRFVDQAIFAARKTETWTLLSKLTLYRAAVLYGESGSGKSSLINAGVLPRLLEEGYVVDRVRVQPFRGREIKIERILRSDHERDGYLPSSFIPDPEDEAIIIDQCAGFELSLAAFRQQLKRLRAGKQDRRTGQAVPSTPLPGPRGGSRALLVLDQFEELITLFDEAQRSVSISEASNAQLDPARTRRRVLVTLVKLIRDKTLPIKIVLAFREDYLAKLSILFDHCPELLNQGQRLLPPHKEVLADIILAPFAQDDLKAHFLQLRDEKRSETGEDETRSEISNDLAKEIAFKLAERGEGDSANLTELQIVCRRLWRSADPETLFRLKGVNGLLREYGTEVFKKFPEELRDPAVTLLERMLTASNTRNIVSEDDLVDRMSPQQQVTLRKALSLLADTRIVRREARRNLHVYEITSEYLVPWIKERVAERKALLLRTVTRERRKRLAAQRRRTRLFQRMFAAMVVLLLLLIALSIIVIKESKQVAEANAQTAVFEQRRIAAETKAQDAQKLQKRYETAFEVIAGKDDGQKLRAIAQIKEWTQQKDFPSQLTLLLVAAQSRTDSQRVQQALKQVLGQAVETDASLSQSITTAAETNEGLAEKLPPRFYIHVADESQRPLAQKVTAALRERAWVVPGIQNVGGDSPYWDNELRYYRKSEPSMPPLEDILSLLEKTTGGKWQPKYIPNHEDSPAIRPGHFEVWFAAPTGKLFVGLTDEEGKVLRGLKMTLSFVPHEGIGVQFSRSRNGQGFIDVPPGNYDVTIRVKGYKDLPLSLSIEVGQQVYWSNLKLTK